MENKFTPEQIEKARECKSAPELLALTKENGINLTEAEAQNLFAQLNPENGELSDDELEAVAGGCGDSDFGDCQRHYYFKCPFCGSTNVTIVEGPVHSDKLFHRCDDCNMRAKEQSFIKVYCE